MATAGSLTHVSRQQERAEVRRLYALDLRREGWKQNEIASVLGVTAGAVSQWFKRTDEQGEAGLLARPRTGRPAQLSAEQKRLIPEFLSHGAEAYGFRGAVWTCPRVSQVIEWEFGVAYHRSHVARLLDELAWTPQLPVIRARQRDEAAIEHWRTEVWMEVKKEPAWSGALWYSWMNRASTCCRPAVGRMPRVGTRPSCRCR